MSLFRKFFDTSSGDTAFLNETPFLVDTGIQILRQETEGGFIKAYFTGKNDELTISLSDTYLLSDMKHTNFSLEEMLLSRYNLNSTVAKKFLEQTQFYVEQEDKSTAWVSFVHHYSQKYSKTNCRKWYAEYIKNKYPSLKLEETSTYTIIFI